VDHAVNRFIEERNYLIFSLANREPIQIKELMTWSLEALYQFIYANNIRAKKMEAQQKTSQERMKSVKNR